MSELPGTIHIKRKLVEDPPDTLYIEHEGHGLEADSSHARPVYRLVQVAKRPRTNQNSPTRPLSQHAYHNGPAQLLQDPRNNSIIIPVVEPSRSSSDKNSDKTPNSTKSKMSIGPLPKRVFHLSAARAMNLSRASSSSSLRTSSRKRGKHPSIAVFAEKKALRIEQMAKSMVSSPPQTSKTLDEGGCEDIKARKKPLTRSMISKKSSQPPMFETNKPNDDENSETELELAAELHRFALETNPPSPPTMQAPAFKIDAAQTTIKPMKHQPRPPRQRSIRNIEDLVVIPTPIARVASRDSLMSQDDSTEWVYDVYVRDIAPAFKQSLNMAIDETRSRTSNSEDNVGYIVIRAEDEQAWEEFMSDEEGSEVDWDDGDQDSNAEDHYANDYPDELDSDDEWAIGKLSDEDFSDKDSYYQSDNEEK